MCNNITRLSVFLIYSRKNNMSKTFYKQVITEFNLFNDKRPKVPGF